MEGEGSIPQLRLDGASMITNRLFVYGTLAPGKSNAHILADLAGTWEKASIHGTIYQVTWGPASGYPGILLNQHDAEVSGLIFNSDELSEHWHRLDAFEGEGYTRVFALARLDKGLSVQAYVYSLSEDYSRVQVAPGSHI
jgi:gamma-glutamylcyclotransferase (GGCT)/AIG2-like uncharacterized protein YtfP